MTACGILLRRKNTKILEPFYQNELSLVFQKLFEYNILMSQVRIWVTSGQKLGQRAQIVKTL